MSYHRCRLRSGAVFMLLLLHAWAASECWGQRTTYRVPLVGAIGRGSLSDKPSSELSLGSVPTSRRTQGSSALSGMSAEATAQEMPSLSPSFERLRDRLRACLARYYRRPEDATYRSPWGIMHGLIAFGIDTDVLVEGRRVNAISWLCSNGKGQDLQLFEVANGRLRPKSGPGLQGHDAQFLFMMAQCEVPLTYPIRVNGYQFTLKDVVEYEQSTCAAGSELNFKLVGLVHYLESDATWTNDRGERWDIPRIIREELTQPIVGACCGGTHRMMGFSYAARKREQRQEPVVGQWLRAQRFVQDYHEYAFKLQNHDGSFSTDWFRSRQAAGEPLRVLETTGHMAEWLAFSLTLQQLVEPRMVKSIDFLTNLLLEDDDWEVGPKGHALHALALYDERVFGSKAGERSFLRHEL